MRLDHLLSKEEQVESCFVIQLSSKVDNAISGGDTPRGHTRSHPEHDG